VGKKFKDVSTLNELAVLAVSKSSGDNICEISKQVVADYFTAIKTIKNYKKEKSTSAVKCKKDQKKKLKEKIKKNEPSKQVDKLA